MPSPMTLLPFPGGPYRNIARPEAIAGPELVQHLGLDDEMRKTLARHAHGRRPCLRPQRAHVRLILPTGTGAGPT
jgi:hypothetical protein